MQAHNKNNKTHKKKTNNQTNDHINKLTSSNFNDLL